MAAILITCPLVGEVAYGSHSHGLTYLPALTEADLQATLAALRPTVLIARRLPDVAILKAWRSVVRSTRLAIVLVGGTIAGSAATGMTVHSCASEDAVTVLAQAERLSTVAAAADRPIAQRIAGGVTLVGAGIVNLITALHLRQAGFTAEIFDACPDPRSGAHWSRYGCTVGGANARMFTLTEADIYRPSHTGTTQFGIPASAGGWRVRATQPPLNPAEQDWLAAHRTLPAWITDVYAADIYRFNREAGQGWQRLRSDLPHLFDGADVRDGIVRLYSRGTQMQTDIQRHRRLRLPIRIFTPTQAARRHPAIANACAAGLVAGALEVPGFTVTIHDLVTRLLSTLEELGVRLNWNTRVSRLHWVQGRVTGVQTATGTVESDHYVLSPGVAVDDLLHRTTVDGTIQGVLGVWLTLPNIDPPLTHSLKIAQDSALIRDTNVTVAHDTMILGSGYGWTGTHADAIDPTELRLVSDALHDTARRYFPRAYAARDPSSAAVRYCVRPWTASGLGVFATHPTDRGGALVVTGGHNTGGFAQAPAVAAAVVAALRGRRHLMHAFYHPHRARWWQPTHRSPPHSPATETP